MSPESSPPGLPGPPEQPRTDPRIVRTLSKVLAATYELLLEVGFDQVTIDAISERSGVSRSTLYRHWDTRDDMLRQAFSAHSILPAADGDTLRSGLRRFTVAFAEGLTKAWGRALVSSALKAMDDPEQQALGDAWVVAMTADVGTLLARAVARGELRAGAEPHAVAEDLQGPLVYRFLVLHDGPDEAFAKAVADRVTERLLAT